MKHALLLFSVLSALSVQAQTHDIIGSVRKADGTALPYAHIIDIHSRMAVAADALGKFQLAVADSGTVLRISHIGFRPVLYTVSPKIPGSSNSRFASISIILSEESTLLSPAVVSVSENTVINGRRGIVLRDFSFADGNQLLLMAENGIRHLMLCDENWQEISRMEVGKKGDRIFEDCLGNAHLFGEDSVYQIEVNNGELSLIAPTEQSYFLEHMAHCATSSTSHIFFSSYQKAGQEVHHYGLDRMMKQRL